MDCCLKVYNREGEVVVAACDKELLGKTFSEGEYELNISSGFYGSHATSLEDVIEALKYASIGNLTGKRVVEAAVSAGYVDEEKVLSIGGVKHAQFAVML